VAKEALTTLKDFGKPPETLARSLGELLKVRTPDVRDYALSALDELGDKATVAVPALSAAIRDSDAAFRKKAGDVLRKVDPNADVPAFAAALKDKNEEIRKEAIAALVEAGDRAKSVSAALTVATSDKNALVRVKAIRLVSKIDKVGRDLLPTYRDALKDKDVKVRQEAAEGLAEMGARAADAVADLCAALKDSDGAVRLSAAAAVNKTGTRDKAILPALIVVLKEEKLHKDITPIILRMEEEAVPGLIEALDDKNAVVRLAVVTILGKIGPAAKDAYRSVLAVYRKDTDPKIRRAASTAMDQIRKK